MINSRTAVSASAFSRNRACLRRLASYLSTSRAPTFRIIELVSRFLPCKVWRAALLGGYGALFLGYSGLLSPAAEVNNSLSLEHTGTITPETKRVIGKLTALFSLDSFGGGFLTDARVSYWFFRQFGLSEHDLGFVLCGSRAKCSFTSWSRLAGWPNRAREYDGVHPSASIYF
jgi:hypothetical protein